MTVCGMVTAGYLHASVGGRQARARRRGKQRKDAEGRRRRQQLARRAGVQQPCRRLFEVLVAARECRLLKQGFEVCARQRGERVHLPVLRDLYFFRARVVFESSLLRSERCAAQPGASAPSRSGRVQSPHSCTVLRSAGCSGYTIAEIRSEEQLLDRPAFTSSHVTPRCLVKLALGLPLISLSQGLHGISLSICSGLMQRAEITSWKQEASSNQPHGETWVPGTTDCQLVQALIEREVELE